jgi:hypothetical protein
MWFQQSITYKKAALQQDLAGPMAELASHAARVWSVPEALDLALAERLNSIPHCHLLYALDADGVQRSANVAIDGIDPHWRGQNLAARPYHTGTLPYRGFLLSTVYISQISLKPCITALQAVLRDTQLLGFVAADFNLHDLPLPESAVTEELEWKQYKGDPVIRSAVFMQQRMNSSMDNQLDAVIAILDRLLCEHGVYHCILHFSSARAVFWVYDDPYNYRLNDLEEILQPELWLAYPPRPYPVRARLSYRQIRPVLEQFRALRAADDNIYLRSASLNVMNGLVGLTFSCDGTHYMQAEDFLARELSFWI